MKIGEAMLICSFLPSVFQVSLSFPDFLISNLSPGQDDSPEAVLQED